MSSKRPQIKTDKFYCEVISGYSGTNHSVRKLAPLVELAKKHGYDLCIDTRIGSYSILFVKDGVIAKEVFAECTLNDAFYGVCSGKLSSAEEIEKKRMEEFNKQDKWINENLRD